MSESANSAKSARQIFANFVKFVKPIFGTTRRSLGRVTEAEYPTNYQRISNLSLTIRPFRVAILAVLLVFVGSWGSEVWATWPTYSGTITKSGSTYYVLNASKEESVFQTGSHPYGLAGPGAKLTFDAKCTLAAVQNLQVYDGYSVIFDEYVGKYRYVFPAGTMDYVSYGGDGSIVVDAQATQVTFRGAPAATLSRYFKNVKVTMFSGTMAPSKTSLNFGAAGYNTTGSTSAYTQTFTIDWSNMSAMSISGLNNTQFSATISNNSSAGKYGTATVTVTYKHDKVGTHNATLTIGGKSVSLSGTTNKITPYIVTTPTVETITYGQTISNSQLGTGLVKADLINAVGTVVPGTWTIDENGQTVSTSGGQNATVHLTFTPSNQNTYNVIQTTQTMFVRSAATITWTSAYSAEKPTIPVGKTIENAASTNANGATVTYSTSDPDVIVIENEGTTFRAIAGGEATITASHGVTATHGSASISKTFKTTYKDIQVIVWTDRFDRLTTEMTSKNLLAQVWIENPVSGERTYSAARTALLEYSVEDNTIVSIPANSTTLTIHKKGNTTLTASVEGNDQYESASVTMEVKVRDPSAGCDDPLLLDIKNNGTNDYLYRLFSDDTKKPALYSDEYAIDVAQGQVPDKLSFGHKGEEYKVIGLSFWTYYSGTIKAQQKVNGNWVDVENSIVTPEKSQWHTKEGVQLDEGATHIRFVRPQGGEGYHYVKDVEVTMKHFIRTATPTVDFGNTIKVNSSEYKDVVINYSNAKGSLQVINPFTKDVTVSDDYIDIDECGAFGSDTLRISFSPTTATEIDDYIVVKDPVVGNSSALSIRVKADVQRADQTIKWNPETNISTIDQILLNGTTNGQEYGQMNIIGYEVTNNDGVISITDGVVTILKPGTVTITATQNGSANYEAATPVVKNFTISAETLTILEAPVASDITYGQTLSASTLSDGSVEDSKHNPVAGSFSWQAASTQPNAGSAQNFIVVFTPDENAAWYNTLTTSVAVNVAAATPVATPSAANIVYGQKVSESLLSSEGTEGKWSWTDEKAEAVLDAGTYNDLAVHFKPSSGNYTELDATVSLTVEKAAATLSWTAAPAELEYNAVGTVYSASSVSDGAITYSIVSGNTYAEIDALTGVLTILEPGQTVTVQAAQAEGKNYLAPEAVTINVTIGAAPLINIFTNAEGDGDWDVPGNWSNGVPTGDEPDVIISGDLIIDEELKVGNLTIEKNSRVVLTVNGDLTVNGASEDRTEYGNLYVQNGGEVEINGGLRVGDLTVEASIGTADGTAESGQVDNAENIVYANAYIEINMDPKDTMDDTKWYGFTVPFDVDAHAGISRKEDGVYCQCTYGTHYMIAEYDADKRLNTGKGWKYITGNTLHAGTFYYLTVEGSYNTYRFKAKEATYTQASPATLAMNGPTTNPNANWNAVGNSTLQHAKVSFEGGTYVQVYENGLDAYRTVSASEATFVVGCPFFIQAKEESTLVLNAPTSATAPYYAPHRSNASQNGVARVNLTSVDGGYSDQIYISGTDKEENAYIAGRDLAKAGESKVVPQLWVDAYNQKLSVHEAAWQGENAICPLGIYVPEEGEYTLTATQPEDGTQVYLTIDGMPVWNISETAYILSLGKGTMNNYGLMLLQASRMPTGVENVESADDEKAQKIILNNQLYILRDSRMYDVTGKKVK